MYSVGKTSQAVALLLSWRNLMDLPEFLGKEDNAVGKCTNFGASQSWA